MPISSTWLVARGTICARCFRAGFRPRGLGALQVTASVSAAGTSMLAGGGGKLPFASRKLYFQLFWIPVPTIPPCALISEPRLPGALRMPLFLLEGFVI
jgi:hypothetical protein